MAKELLEIWERPVSEVLLNYQNRKKKAKKLKRKKEKREKAKPN